LPDSPVGGKNRAKAPGAIGADRGAIVLDFREILTLAMIFIPLERLLPQRPEQRVFRRQWLNDTIYLFCNGFVVRVGVLLILGAAMSLFAARQPEGGSGWISTLPLWLQVIGATIVADVGFYAHHRLFHAVPFLWRFHAVHHSIEELDWLAAHRVHPFDQIVSSTFSILPLYLLGFSGEAMILAGFIYLLQSHLIHSNAAIGFGPLRWIFASPHFHHWHHSNMPGTHDTNFSGQLLFMDWIFGTLKMPEGLPAVYGTDDPVPTLYPLQLAWPLLRQPGAPATPPAAGEVAG
jgi:sterol desaturase/sphingolipid hydroxylase (fatty acid hydroxylase superfamily)